MKFKIIVFAILLIVLSFLYLATENTNTSYQSPSYNTTRPDENKALKDLKLN